jgi:DNA-binding response OmpR family regulator
MTYVLIVDDDPMVRNMLVQFFALDGYQTTGASNGKEALRMYRDSPADLVVTDMIMPEMDGIETIQAVRRENPDAKIIAISGGGRNSPEDYLVLAEHFGADRTFTKPVECKALVAAARELLSCNSM